MRVLITGATGLSGLNVYRAAIEDPAVTAITLLLRREIPSWAVLPQNASEKTTTILHQDFGKYEPELASQLAQHDACLWVLGKSSRGMAEAEYTTLTHDYPMAMLNALRDSGVGMNRPVDKPFRFLYWSGQYADPTEKSIQMWARVKGRTETHILDFCKSIPGVEAYILRPGYICPSKKYPQDVANQRTCFKRSMDRVMIPGLGLLAPSSMISVEQLAKAALEIAKGRFSGTKLFENTALLDAAKVE
ncbi:hypothetical protein BDY19DRAFT_993705 [Irpex rosettiformis]|uniref:Uncharacterized protein n=1 Tax=Irpex rosettiformis TaxID=378272 RepID=A0ACB8U3I7_9APHY|nr:hypothetical protein BDY19DRAFT_993705 [Irpex rosettiformis]